MDLESHEDNKDSSIPESKTDHVFVYIHSDSLIMLLLSTTLQEEHKF